MEHLPTNAKPFIKNARYNNYFVMCLLLASFRNMLCYLTISATNSRGLRESYQALTYCMPRICLAAVVIGVGCFMFLADIKDALFHRVQEVFWPLRCRHCAKAVGLGQQQLRSRRAQFTRATGVKRHDNFPQCRRCIRHVYACERARNPNGSGVKRHYQSQTYERNKNHVREVYRRGASSALPLPPFPDLARLHQGMRSTVASHIERDNNCPLRSYSCSSSQSMSLLCHGRSESNSFPSQSFTSLHDMNAERHSRPLYTKPHKSVLHNMFIVFGVISVINIPVQIACVVYCLAVNNNTSIYSLVLGSQLIMDLSFISIIVIGMVFFTKYYDAVFIDEAKYSYTIGFLQCACIWIAAVKIMFPLNRILENQVSNDDCTRRLNFAMDHEKIMSPFYAESAIIAAGLLWHIWSSILPKSFLKMSCIEPEFDRFRSNNQYSTLDKFFTFLKTCFKVKRTAEISVEEAQHLIPESDFKRPHWNLWMSFRRKIALALVIGVIYLSFNQFIRFHVILTWKFTSNGVWRWRFVYQS